MSKDRVIYSHCEVEIVRQMANQAVIATTVFALIKL